MGRRNPNGYGSITKLSGNRSKPWMVRTYVYEKDGTGRQKPIGYAATEAEAHMLLAEYNKSPWNINRNMTLSEVYELWMETKMPLLGDSNATGLRAAYNYCSKYYGFKYREMKSYHMQDCIDNCGKGYGSQKGIKNLFHHLDKFAYEIDLIDKMYSQLTTSARPEEDTTREPFTEEEIQALWNLQSNDTGAKMILIFIYTGFRHSELLNMQSSQVNLEEHYFKGGIKTESGKNRIVPIHPRIEPFVKEFLEKGSEYLIPGLKGGRLWKVPFYKIWYETLSKINANKPPHSARHTFETMLDNAKANKKCIDLLMGHKSKDVGTRVYNHKTLDQLRETINLLT